VLSAVAFVRALAPRGLPSGLGRRLSGGVVRAAHA